MMRFSLASASLSDSVFPIVMTAMFGGILVLVGLIMEKRIEVDGFENLRDMKCRKGTAHLGWWILMAGIVVEIGDAGYVAWSDWMEKKEIKKYAESIDPLNQPIGDVSAIVTIKLLGKNFIESPLYGSPSVANLSLTDGEHIGMNVGGFWAFLSVEKEDVRHVDYSFLISPRDTNAHGYVLKFNQGGHNYITTIPVTRYSPQKVRTIIDNVSMLLIDTKFIPHDAQLLGGSVQIFINGGQIKGVFDIFPQKAFPSPMGLGTNIDLSDSGFSFIATNADWRIFTTPINLAPNPVKSTRNPN